METDLYPPIKIHLERLGLEVKGEVCGCDLVALSDGSPELVVIGEMKQSFTLELVLQAVDRTSACDEVWLAIGASKRDAAGRTTRAVEAAVAKSREIAAPECIAVVDAGGNLLAFARVDGAAVLARDPAIAKAATSASLGAPTGGIPFEFGANLGFASHGGIANLGGGFPIVFMASCWERSASGRERLSRTSLWPRLVATRYWRRSPPRDVWRPDHRSYRHQGRSRMTLHRTAIIACLSIAVGSLPVAAAQNKGETRMAQNSSPTAAKQLASDRPIGHIEPVFEFYDAMPTGVTVAADGRIFINFPRWGDDVPFTVGEIRNGKVVPYPDAAINTFDPTRPGETLGSVQSVVVDPVNRLWILDTAARRAFRAPGRAAVRSWLRWTWRPTRS